MGRAQDTSIERINLFVSNPAFKAPRVREAIMTLLDQDRFFESSITGGSPFDGLVPGLPVKISRPFNGSVKDRRDYARSLLIAEGIPLDGSFTIRAGTVSFENVRPYLRLPIQELQEIGLDVSFLSYSSFKELTEAAVNGELDISVFSWQSFAYDPAYYLRSLLPQIGFKWDETGMSQVVDNLAAVMQTETMDAREEQALNVSNLVINSNYVRPLFINEHIFLYRDTVDISKFNAHTSNAKYIHRQN